MKRPTSILPLLLTSLLCLASGGEVANGQVPKNKPQTITFTEDLRLGPDSGDDHYLWSGASTTIEVNDKGHMFLVEPNSNRILEFDTKGQFLQQIGREGQGPGEFRKLNSFKVLADGSAVAFDNQQGGVNIFTYYDKEMKYVDRKMYSTAGMGLQSAVLSPNGKYMASLYLEFDSKQPQISIIKTGILDNERKLLLPLTETKQPGFDSSQANNPNWWSKFLSSWFKLSINGLGVMAFGPDSSVYTAVNNEYKIIRYDPNLKQTQVITREYKPIRQSQEAISAFADPLRDELLGALPAELRDIVTEKVVKKAIELAEFPPRKAPIFGIIPMEDKGFLVVHDFDPITNQSVADIFSPEGVFLGSARLPQMTLNIFGGFFGNPTKMVFANGFAYTVEPSEDGLNLVRYTYKVHPK